MKVEINGIDALIKKLEAKRDSLEEKKRLFMERLAQIGFNTAYIGFSNAEYDGTNDVVVTAPEWVNADTIAVKANGSSILFIEFGSGIRFPEHPLSDEFGYQHGTYGKGQGANPKGWVYKGDPGTGGMPITDRQGKVKDGVYRTFGNPPARAMYEAGKQMRENMLKIAAEVFGND